MTALLLYFFPRALSGEINFSEQKQLQSISIMTILSSRTAFYTCAHKNLLYLAAVD